MTTPAQPPAQTTAPAPASTPKEPTYFLLVLCVECGEGHAVPIPLDRVALEVTLARRGWYTSVVTPPSHDPTVPIGLGAICVTCAARQFPAEILKAIELRRLKIVADAEKAVPTP